MAHLATTASVSEKLDVSVLLVPYSGKGVYREEGMQLLSIK